MSGFVLDTSGVVGSVERNKHGRHWWSWTDLDPFPQGYVEALFADIHHNSIAVSLRNAKFRDLADETLETILKDCAEGSVGLRYTNPEMQAAFDREAGALLFRRLGRTVYLDDDGKVRLSPSCASPLGRQSLALEKTKTTTEGEGR